MVECFLNNLLSQLVHRSHKHFDELVILEHAVVIEIEGLKRILDINIREVNLKILDGLTELFELQDSIAAGVSQAELSPQSDESSNASLRQLELEPLDEDLLEFSKLDLRKKRDQSRNGQFLKQVDYLLSVFPSKI